MLEEDNEQDDDLDLDVEQPDPLTPLREKKLTFEDIATRPEFQSADLDTRLGYIDNLAKHNKSLFEGQDAEEDNLYIDAQTQLQQRLVSSADAMKNAPEWSKEHHKMSYDTLVEFYDSDKTQEDFDKFEYQQAEVNQNLRMGEYSQYLKPLKSGADSVEMEVGGEVASLTDFSDAKSRVENGEFVYLATDDYISNTEDGYIDPDMPANIGRAYDAENDVWNEDVTLNNVKRMSADDEVRWAEDIVNTISGIEDAETLQSKIVEMGATRSQITKRVSMGLLSLNTGEYLLNSLYDDSAMSSEYGSEEDFNEFLSRSPEASEKYKQAVTRYNSRNGENSFYVKPLQWLGNTAVDVLGDNVDSAELAAFDNLQQQYAQDWVSRNKDKAGVTRDDIKAVYGEEGNIKKDLGVTGWQELKETWRGAIQNAFGSTVGIVGGAGGGLIARYGDETSALADKMLRLNTLSAKDWWSGLKQNFKSVAIEEHQEHESKVNKTFSEWQAHYDNKPRHMNAEQQAAWEAETTVLVDRLAEESMARATAYFGDEAGNVDDYNILKTPDLLAEASAYASNANPKSLERMQSILRVNPTTRGYRNERDDFAQSLGTDGMNKLAQGYFGGHTAGWQELGVEVASMATGYAGAKIILKARKATKFATLAQTAPKQAIQKMLKQDALMLTKKGKFIKAASRAKYPAALIPAALAEGAEEGVVELGNPDITWDSFKHAVKQGMMGGAGLGVPVTAIAAHQTIKNEQANRDFVLGEKLGELVVEERDAIIGKLIESDANLTAEALYDAENARQEIRSNTISVDDLEFTQSERAARFEDARSNYEEAKKASDATPQDEALKREAAAAFTYAVTAKQMYEESTQALIDAGKIDLQSKEGAVNPGDTKSAPKATQARSSSLPATSLPVGEQKGTGGKGTGSSKSNPTVDNLSDSAETRLENEQDESAWQEAKAKYNITFVEGGRKQTAQAFMKAAQQIQRDLNSKDPAVVEAARNEARVLGAKQRARAKYAGKTGGDSVAGIIAKEADKFEALASGSTTPTAQTQSADTTTPTPTPTPTVTAEERAAEDARIDQEAGEATAKTDAPEVQRPGSRLKVTKKKAVKQEPTTTPQVGETRTVYKPDGTPVEVTVTAVSNSGLYRGDTQSGENILASGVDYFEQNPTTEDRAIVSSDISTTKKFQGVKMSELSDADLATADNVLTERIAKRPNGKQAADFASRADLTAIKAEVARRASATSQDTVGIAEPETSTQEEPAFVNLLLNAEQEREQESSGVASVSAEQEREQESNDSSESDSVDVLDTQHNSLSDAVKIATDVLDAPQNEEQTGASFKAMVQSMAPGLDLSNIDVQFTDGDTTLGIVPYAYADGRQADKYTIKISRKWRERLAKHVGVDDYSKATSAQKRLVALWVARAVDEETRHVVLFKNTTPEQRAEIAKDILADKKAVEVLGLYFKREGSLEQQENEDDANYNNRIVAEFINIVQQRAVYGLSNSEFMNMVAGLSDSVRKFVSKILQQLKAYLTGRQDVEYSPVVQDHINKLNKAIGVVMLDESAQVQNVLPTEEFVPAKFDYLPQREVEQEQSLELDYLRSVNDSLLRPVAGADLDTIDGAFGVDAQGNLFIRLSAQVLKQVQTRLSDVESMKALQLKRAFPSLATVVANLNSSKVFVNAVSVIVDYTKSASVKADVIYKSYTNAVHSYRSAYDKWQALHEDKIAEAAPLKAAYEKSKSEGKEDTDLLDEWLRVVDDPAVDEARRGVERLHTELLLAENAMPKSFRRAMSTVMQIAGLAKSAPSVEYLKQRGLALGASVEARLERQALRERALQAVKPMIPFFENLNLTPFLGSSIRNHAPTKALMRFNDGNLDIAELGFLMSRLSRQEVFVTITPRMVADMIGVKNRIIRMQKEGGKYDTKNDVILKRIDAVLDHKVVKNMDQSEIDRHYASDVFASDSFGTSVFFLRKDDTLRKDGKISYQLSPQHLNEFEAEAFNQNRAADVRYTMGANYSGRIHRAHKLGNISLTYKQAVERGNPAAPLTIGLEGTSRKSEGAPALLKAIADTLLVDEVGVPNDNKADANKVAIPFPGYIKRGSKNPNMQLEWTKAIGKFFRLISAQNLTDEQKSLHPVSQYADAILELAIQHYKNPSVYTYNNLMFRVMNLSDLVVEMKKQVVNQQQSIGEYRLDFRMLENIERQVQKSNVSNINPLQLEQLLDTNTSVDAATAVIYKEGESSELFTNKDDSNKQTELNEQARVHGLDYKSTEKEAAQKRSLMLAVLFDLDIRKAKDWAAGFNSTRALDAYLFKKLDDAVDMHNSTTTSTERIQLAELLGAVTMTEGRNAAFYTALRDDVEEQQMSEAQQLQALRTALELDKEQLNSGGWSKSSVASLIEHSQSEQAIVGLKGKGSYGKVVMTRLLDYIQRYNLDEVFITSYINNGKEHRRVLTGVTTLEHLMEQTGRKRAVVNNIIGIMKGVRRARADVNQLTQDIRIREAKIKELTDKGITEKELDDAANLQVIGSHIMNLPPGKVHTPTFRKLFGRVGTLDSTESTTQEFLGSLLSEKYGDVTVVVYDASGLNKKDVGYETNHLLLNEAGDVKAILMEGVDGHFSTGAEKIVSQLTVHALQAGLTEETTHSLDNLKLALDQYFAGDFIEAQTQAEVRALMEMQTKVTTLDESIFDDYKQRSHHWQVRQLESINADLAKVMGWGKATGDMYTHFSDMSNVDFIMATLLNDRMRHYVGHIAAGNTTFEATSSAISEESIANANTYLEVGKFDAFSADNSAIEQDMLSNVGEELTDEESANLGAGASADTQFGISPGTTYLSTYYKDDSAVSVFPQIVGFAFDMIATSDAVAATPSIDYKGQRDAQSDAIPSAHSVTDFFDYTFKEKQINKSKQTAREKIWSSVLNKTKEDRWFFVNEVGAQTPDTGLVNSTELRMYRDAKRAALEVYDAFKAKIDDLRKTQESIAKTLADYDVSGMPFVLADPADMMHASMKRDYAAVTARLSRAESSLAGRSRNDYAEGKAIEVGLEQYETRVLQERSYNRRAFKNNQQSKEMAVQSSLYKSPSDFNLQLQSTVDRILQQSNKLVDGDVNNRYAEEESVPLPQNVVNINDDASTSGSVVPQVTGSNTGNAVPSHSAVPSVSGVEQSPQAEIEAEEYTQRVKKRLYNTNGRYKKLMDESPNHPQAVEVNGLISTLADIATNKSFRMEVRNKANSTLSSLIGGNWSQFSSDANHLRSLSQAPAIIDQVVDGLNPKHKSIKNNPIFRTQHAGIADLFSKTNQAFKRGFMMMGEQDFGVHGNAGRMPYKVKQTDLTDRFTKSSNRAGALFMTQAYVGTLITNVSKGGAKQQRKQVFRNMSALMEGAIININNAKFLDRETLQLSEYAQDIINKALSWFEANAKATPQQLHDYLMSTLKGEKAEIAKGVIKEAVEFFQANQAGTEIRAAFHGKEVGAYERYLPYRGFDLNKTADLGLDGVDAEQYVDVSKSFERSRFELDDAEQTRGLDFNALRAILSGTNAQLYHAYTHDAVTKARYDFGGLGVHSGINSAIRAQAMADKTLSREQQNALIQMSATMAQEVERQRFNDSSHNPHAGKVLDIANSAGSAGYAITLSSLQQAFLQTVPGYLSYVMNHPIKGAKLTKNLIKMAFSFTQGQSNRLVGSSFDSYFDDVSGFIKQIAPEIHARGLDGIDELKHGASKFNMNEIHSLTDAALAAGTLPFKAIKTLMDLVLHATTGAPDAFLVRAIYATEFEARTGRTIGSDTFDNITATDLEAAIMSDVIAQDIMAQSDSGKKGDFFQPVQREDKAGAALEVLRKSAGVYANHLLSKSAMLPAAFSMLRSKDMKLQGARIISDWTLQIVLFNALKIRSIAYLTGIVLTGKPNDEDEWDDLNAKLASGEGLTTDEQKRHASLKVEFDAYDQAVLEKQNSVLEAWHSVPGTGKKPKLWTGDDFMYSVGIKSAVEMTGMLTPVMAIPEINGLVLDGVKGLTARATGIDYAGRGSKRVTDDYTRFTDKMGAPGKFVSNLIVSGSHYAMAQSDYEMSYDDVLMGLYAFGGLRESRAAVQERVRDKNNSYYYVEEHRSAPGFFEHRPQALRFHQLMDRPTGLNDFSLVHHPASRVDMSMFEGMKIEEVDLLNRPYNDGDSMQMSTGFLKSTNYRLAMIDTLETSGKSKVMLDRVYGQARATGIEPTNIIPTGKKQSYITQHAHVTADRVFIAHNNKVGFERDRKSTERVDAIMLVEKDGVLYDHGLSMAYNGDASITYYGISRLPKQVQKEYRERYKRANEVQKNGSLGTINTARSKKNPKTQSQQSKVKSPSVRSDPRGGRDLRLLRRLGR